jgi:SRSO17 transposase
VPQAWAHDRERCRPAGSPADRPCAPTPQRARPRLARACAAGVPAKGGPGDGVEGADRHLRVWLEARPQAYGWAVAGQEEAWLGGRQPQVKPLGAALPPAGWTRRSAGDSATGPRWSDWRWRPRAEPQEPGWRRWLLVRRRLSVPTALTASRVFAPQDTPLAAVVQVAGTRWTIDSRFEAATGEMGLDDSAVRSWTGG